MEEIQAAVTRIASIESDLRHMRAMAKHGKEAPARRAAVQVHSLETEQFVIVTRLYELSEALYKTTASHIIK